MSMTPTGHTVKRYDDELESLRQQVLAMGVLVDQQLADTLGTFKLHDHVLARNIIDRDIDVDRFEVEVDEKILELIARRCPMGSDLRSIICLSKSVSDLEKIGDEAVRIVGFLHELPDQGEENLAENAHVEIERIGTMALSLFRDALSLFKSWDEDRALQVIESHTEMDSQFQSELQRLMTYLTQDSLRIGQAVNLALIAKSLDRITHHAQNLAEYALFEIKGVDLRVSQKATSFGRETG